MFGVFSTHLYCCMYTRLPYIFSFHFESCFYCLLRFSAKLIDLNSNMNHVSHSTYLHCEYIWIQRKQFYEARMISFFRKIPFRSNLCKVFIKTYFFLGGGVKASTCSNKCIYKMHFVFLPHLAYAIYKMAENSRTLYVHRNEYRQSNIN